MLAAGSVQRIDDHAKSRRPDGILVDTAFECLDVGGNEIDFRIGAARLGRLVGKQCLDAIGEFLRGRSTVGHAQLHAEVLCRIVAARQHNAADSALVLINRPAQRGRRAVVGSELYEEPVRRRHFGSKTSIRMCVLPAVMPDDNGSRLFGRAARSKRFLLERGRCSVDDAHEVFVSKIFADDGSPPIGSEMYCICHAGLQT